jgi:hypothetical protein
MNRATRFIVSTLGIILAIAGFDHGFFETLQGNRPTSGLIIQAIGPEQTLWGGVLMSSGGLVWMIWHLMIARKLLQHAKD